MGAPRPRVLETIPPAGHIMLPSDFIMQSSGSIIFGPNAVYFPVSLRQGSLITTILLFISSLTFINMSALSVRPPRSENSHVEACTALHERWMHHQRQWFNGSLADSEHKLIVTEEARRKAKVAASLATSSSLGVSSSDHAYYHRHLRWALRRKEGEKSNVFCPTARPRRQVNGSMLLRLGSS